MPSGLSIRIKSIQKAIGITQTGNYDVNTINKLSGLMNLKPGSNTQLSKKEAIQKKLGFTGKEVDGLFGVNTTTRLEFYISNNLPAIPTGASMIVSKKGLDLILESEISSESIYNSIYKNPIWPKSASGITIGIGYDLGYETVAKIEKDWAGALQASDIKKLRSVAGIKGTAARDALSNNKGGIKSVSVPFMKAKEVFYVNSMPSYAKLTRSIYPDIANLPPDAQAALVSIVYNRGNSLSGDRRKEMKNIVPLVRKADLKGIAAQIRSMKRLWTTAATKGLLTRREREAVLVENATFFYNPDEIIIL